MNEFEAILYSGDYQTSEWLGEDEDGYRQVFLLTRDGKLVSGLVRNAWQKNEEIQELGVVKQNDVITERQKNAQRFLDEKNMRERIENGNKDTIDNGRSL